MTTSLPPTPPTPGGAPAPGERPDPGAGPTGEAGPAPGVDPTRQGGPTAPDGLPPGVGPVQGGAARPLASKVIKWGALGVVLVIVVVGVASAVLLGRSEPRRAEVGDCLAGQAAEEIEVVACDDSRAAYKIVGKIDSITQSDWDAKDNACEAYPTAESSFWEGTEGKAGYALCLESVER